MRQNNQWRVDSDSVALRSAIPGLGTRLRTQVEQETADIEAKYFDLYEQTHNPFAEVMNLTMCMCECPCVLM